jgi:tape measure domain-containing protein
MELQRLTTVFDVDMTGLQTGRVQVDAFFSDAEKRASDSVSRFDRISRDIGKTIGTGIKVGLGDISAGVDSLISITEKGLSAIPGLGGVLGATFKESAGAMRDAINVGFEWNDMMRRSSVTLGLVAGGANDATKELAGLRSISSNSEFGLPALVAAASELQIMQGNARNVVPEIQAIADAASALGKGEGGLNAIAEVLGRINEMEKVSTRDARQLIRQGIPVFDIIGEAAGMSSQRAKRLLDTGRIQIDTFTDAILGYFQRKYPDAARQMAQTMEVQNAKLASGMAALKGAAFQPFYNDTLRGYVDLNAAIRGPEAGKMAASLSTSTLLVQSLLTKTLDAAKSGNLIGKFEELGSDAIKSATKGVVANVADLYAAGSNAFARLEQGWRDEAKQHSPSQVMYDLGFGAGLSAYMGFNAAITGHRFSDEIEKAIKEAAEKFKIDPELIRAVIEQESHGNRKAVSPKGAQGLMQLMPGTASRYGVTNPFDVEQNIMGGAHYLADLLKMFGDVKLALAAYNAGPGAVIKYGNKVPPYAETRDYVSKVFGNYSRGVDGPVPVTVTNLPALALGHTPPGGASSPFGIVSPHQEAELKRLIKEREDYVAEVVSKQTFDIQVRDWSLAEAKRFENPRDFDELMRRNNALSWAENYQRGLENLDKESAAFLKDIDARVAALRARMASTVVGGSTVGGTSPLLNPSLNIDLNQPQPRPSLLPLPEISLDPTPARELAVTTAWLADHLDQTTQKTEVFGQKAQKELRGIRGAMLQLGLDSKTVGDSFENNFLSAFDHVGEAGHNFARELGLGIVQDLKHNVGQYLAGELRDDIFGSPDGKKKGLLSGLENEIAKLFGGGSKDDSKQTVDGNTSALHEAAHALGQVVGIGGQLDSSITSQVTSTVTSTSAITLNTDATTLNTEALHELTAAMQSSAGGAGSTFGNILKMALGDAGSLLGGLHLGGSDLGPDILPHGDPGSPPDIPDVGGDVMATNAGHFATGGSFIVGGRPGTDANLIAFRATRGERVSVETPEQQRAGRGGNVVINHYHTHNWSLPHNADLAYMLSRETQSQVEHRMRSAMARATQYDYPQQ